MGLLKKVWRAAGLPGGLGGPQGAAPAPDHALYVIGDVHGRDDLLERLIAMIDADIAEHGIESAKLVLVGDYVDRGDDSAKVLERVHALDLAQHIPVICLTGNHEDMLLQFLDEPRSGPRWLRNGGLQTLASFGVGGVSTGSDREALREAAQKFRAALGPEREAWLRGLDLTYRTGNVVVVHAAMDPALGPDEQTEDALLWGHPGFMRKPRPDGLCVVHGHTIVDKAEVLPGRIPVDTGAVFTGRLTAVVLTPDAPPRFLQT